jgi:exopolyphosphatase/guanosine-5'-triphosphate,3'-diphosphate pyrophosphatase
MPPAGDASRVAAVLDVGSHSVLLLTVAVDAVGRARAVDEALATTRLGAGLRPGGLLDAAAAARTCAAVVAFAGRARTRGATDVWAFATGAVRRAADGAEFARTLGALAGAPVDVLSGEREAALAYAAVAHGLDTAGGPLLAVDIGGATTELTLGCGAAIDDVVSLPLGALALTEAFLHTDPLRPEHIARLADAVDEALSGAPLLDAAQRAGARVVASGGTATALAAVDLQLATYEPKRVHGVQLAADALAALLDRLLVLPRAARAELGALDPGRAAILPAGALVLDAILRAAGAAAVQVSDHGVRHGYLRERIAATGGAADLRCLWG